MINRETRDRKGGHKMSQLPSQTFKVKPFMKKNFLGIKGFNYHEEGYLAHPELNSYAIRSDRKAKREIKRLGNKRLRRQAKRATYEALHQVELDHVEDHLDALFEDYEFYEDAYRREEDYFYNLNKEFLENYQDKDWDYLHYDHDAEGDYYEFTRYDTNDTFWDEGSFPCHPSSIIISRNDVGKTLAELMREHGLNPDGY